MIDNRASPDPPDLAWQLLAEFTALDEPSGEQELAERVTAVVRPLGLQPAQVERIGRAVWGAAHNGVTRGRQARRSLPVVVRIWVSGTVADNPSTPDLDAAGGDRRGHQAWGLFFVKKQVEDPQAPGVGPYYSVELFLYREK